MSGNPNFDFLCFACMLGFLVLYVFGCPCLIYQTQRFKARPALLRFDLDMTPPPGSAGRFFHSQDEQFQALGFTRLDCLTLPDAVPNVKALLVMYSHRRNQDLGLVTMMYGLNP